MKIRTNYITLLLTLALAATSCSDHFLDEEPSTSVSVGKAILTDNDMLEATAGLYRILQGYYLFGRNAVVFGDMLADNVYLSSTNSSRLLTQNNYSFEAASAEARLLWAQSYYAILQANRIIGAALPESDRVNQLKGEAYVLRAFCYLNLVNWFAAPATVDPSMPGVPVVTVSTDVAGALIKPARNTIAEVYDRIVADLETAYQLMPATPPSIHLNNTNFVSKYAAKALEARAQLYRGNYEKARDAALLVVENGGFSLAATAEAFTSYWASAAARTDKVETLFEINNSATANNGVEGLDYLYSKAGLGDLLVTDNTYALYSTTDRRRALIEDGVRGGNQVYYVKKYQNVTGTDRDEVKILRYAEVVLTLAEAYARLSDETNALKYLNQVAQNRDPELEGYSLTGEALVSAVIAERRKELAFEGLRFFDLKRIATDFTRQNMGEKAAAIYTNVLKTDFRRLQPIPQVEMAANPNITQNPGYSN